MPDPAQLEYCLLRHQELCMTRSEWASWLQAGSALIGIAVAIGVVWYQLSETRKSANRARCSKLKGCDALLMCIRDATQVISSEHKTGQAIRQELIESQVDQINEAARLMAEVASEGNNTEVRVMLRTRSAMRRIQPIVDRALVAVLDPGELKVLDAAAEELHHLHVQVQDIWVDLGQ